MSLRVKVDYEGISIEVSSICELASAQLCRLDALLEELERGAQTLINGEYEALKKEILELENRLRERIDAVLETARANASKGVAYDYREIAHKPIYQANLLKREVNKIFSVRIAEIQALLIRLTNESIAARSQELYENAFCGANSEFTRALAEVEDGLLKQYIYLEWLNDRGADFDTLKTRGSAAMNGETDRFFEQSRDRQLDSLKAEMKQAGVAPEKIEQIVSDNASGTAKEQLISAREKASDEIVDETVRKKTLGIIREIIAKHGFIIPKGGVKIQRDVDEVVVVAQRPSGETAECRISLDGKFIYHFSSADGVGCVKDASQFEEDLETVYGIRIKSRETLGGNPERHSAKAYNRADIRHKKGG